MKRVLLLFSVLALVVAGCKKDPYPKANQDESDQYFRQDGDLAGSHILIAYKGAQMAKATRSKAEAKTLAEKLLAELKGNPGKFAELAKAQSDDKETAAAGGDLGSWPAGAMVPDFEVGIRQTKVGQVHDKVVETAYGYHIIKRNSIKTKFFGGHVFIIGFTGQNLPGIKRTKAQAKQFAEELKSKITSANFEEMANKYNDFGRGPVFTQPFTAATPGMPKHIIPLMESLKYGEVGGPIETPNGYTFIKRMKLQMLSADHILIAYKGAQRAMEVDTTKKVTRTREEALALAQKILTDVKKNPTMFEMNVIMNSDDQYTKSLGGKLGNWFLGGFPEFDAAINKVKVNEIVPEVVSTPYGFHIMRRRDVGNATSE